MVLELTERGRSAAALSWKATDRVDKALEAAVGAKAVAQMRETLGTLVALRSPASE
jgi:DNA-binding MarR family transcriptional regulator